MKSEVQPFTLEEKFLEWLAAFGAAFVLFVSRVQVLYPVARAIWRGLVFFLTWPVVISRKIDRLAHVVDVAAANTARSRFSDDLLPVAVYECRVSDGMCVGANKALCDLFGLSREQMMGHGWIAGIAHDERARCYEEYEKARRLELPYGWCYTVVNQETRERIPCESLMTVLKDDSGRPVLYKGTVIPKPRTP